MLLLDETVDRGRRAGDERDAERAEQAPPQRRQARDREEHADDRGEHDQRHDARLGQRQELTDAGFGERDDVHRADSSIVGSDADSRAAHGSDRQYLSSPAASALQPIRDALRSRVRSLAMPRMSGSSGSMAKQVSKRVDHIHGARQQIGRAAGNPDHDEVGMRCEHRRRRHHVPGNSPCANDPVLVLALHRARLPRRVQRLVACETAVARRAPQQHPAATQLVEPERRAVRALSRDQRRGRGGGAPVVRRRLARKPVIDSIGGDDRRQRKRGDQKDDPTSARGRSRCRVNP